MATPQDAVPALKTVSNGKGEAIDILTLAGSLVSTIDLDDYLKKISQSAEHLLDSEVCSVFLLSEDKKQLLFKFASGDSANNLKKMTIPVGTGIVGWVAANGKPEVVADVKTDKRFEASFDKTSGFITRSAICVPIIFRGELAGVLEVLNRRSGLYTEDHVRTLSGLANLASIAIANARLMQDNQNFFSHILELLGSSIEVVKPNMHGHSGRCVRLACAIGKAMELDEYDYRMLYYASYLHDMGYLVLNNPKTAANLGFPQTNEEQHPTVSVKMLEGIKMLEGALPIIQHHHESYDGTGYPNNLKGEQIPLGARILFLVETLEELRVTSGMEGDGLRAHAVRQIKEGSGTRYDPKVASIAVEILENYKDIW